MAIDTNNKKMAVMVFCQVYLPAVYMTIDNSIDQGEQQQFLWQYPGLAFAEYTVVDATAVMGLSLGLGMGM